MNLVPQSLFRSRHKSLVLLIGGVLAGVTVGGGVGVIAASSTKSVTVCSNKKTDVLRYAKNDKCTATEIKVVLNQTGVDGAKGDTGVAGTNGTAGAKGDTGVAGTNGTAGAKGDTGVAGTNGAAGASSPTGFTARSVCGSNGTTLCAVGVQGPGGGTIFYVDTTNEIAGYDYLEAAPANASTGIALSTIVTKCGTVANVSCQASFITDAGNALQHLGLGTGRAATAAIVARHDAGGVAKNLYAAGVADAYTTATAADWWLPSRDELNELCKYARNTAQAAGAGTVCTNGGLRLGFASVGYWSVSESSIYDAWSQGFNDGSQAVGGKYGMNNVRPVRGF